MSPRPGPWDGSENGFDDQGGAKDRHVGVAGMTDGSQTSEGPTAGLEQKALVLQGIARHPGGTRTPNLLIRRWPSGVRERPQPSTQSGVERFPLRRRPWMSEAVHRQWLPTWLPSWRVNPGPRRAGHGLRDMGFTAAVTQEHPWYVARCLELEITSQGVPIELSRPSCLVPTYRQESVIRM